MRFAFTLKESIVGVDHLTFEVGMGDLVSVRNFFPKPLVWVWGMFKWLAAGTYVFYQRNIFNSQYGINYFFAWKGKPLITVE